jgi:RNA polymerase sigma-70 factor (ECF subfamily)
MIFRFGPRSTDYPRLEREIGVPQTSDEAVVERCQRGDVELFSVLVERYRDSIYGYAYHLTGDSEEARDLAQEALVRAYVALPRFRPGAKFSSWLYTIVANLCKSWLRKQKYRPVSLEDAFPESEAADESADAASPAEIHDRQEFKRRVLRAVNDLPTKYRIVVVLRHLNDLSYKEIADILKLPVSTVEHRLRTARELLKPKLRRDLEGWEEAGN